MAAVAAPKVVVQAVANGGSIPTAGMAGGVIHVGAGTIVAAAAAAAALATAAIAAAESDGNDGRDDAFADDDNDDNDDNDDDDGDIVQNW